MFLEVYLEALEELPFGKKLPNAVYIYRYSGAKLNRELREYLKRLAHWASVPKHFNVLKLYKDAPRVSFLYYPGFFTEAHPALHTAINVGNQTKPSTLRGLLEGSVAWVENTKRWDYTKSVNPPILHKKELMLPNGHYKACGWNVLTAYEEEAGLFDDPARIGNKLQWEALLKDKGYEIVFEPARGLSGIDRHVLRKVT